MSKARKRRPTKILWRCAVVFLACACFSTAVHNRPAASETQTEAAAYNNPTDGAGETTAATVEADPLIYESGTQEGNETPETEEPESRYETLTESEIELLAKVIYLEARGESTKGQQAVAEVVLNRVASDQFPDTLEEVVYQEGQFSTASQIPTAEPEDAQYKAIFSAMYGENILPMDVVFFATSPENDSLWGWIGNHAFCYAYDWGD